MREMKDSGIEWIKQIPTGWTTTRGKNILQLMKRPPDADDELITCFRDGEVTLRRNRREEGFTFSDKEIGYQGIKKGDLVIHGMDGFAGAIGISDSDGKGSPVLVVCTTKENARYLVYYLRTLAMQEVFLALATGIRERSCDLRWNKIADLLFPVPELNEQCRIADYLDRKCSQIDAIIARQQEVIKKLKAYKLSVITEAVTKGLNPNVPMKDSGVEWIGEIPVHWDLIKATRIIISTQNGLSRRDLSNSTGKIVLKLRNISSNGEIDYEYQNRIELTGQELDTYRLSDGDILFVRVNGSKSLVGKCAIFHSIGEDVAYNDHIIRVRISEKCIEKFFFWYLLSICGKMEIDLHTSTSAGQYTISGEELRDIRFILPPKIEQLEIDRYLSKMSRCIDKIIHQKQISIDELSAYKKSLIFEVVTGKREV